LVDSLVYVFSRFIRWIIVNSLLDCLNISLWFCVLTPFQLIHSPSASPRFQINIRPNSETPIFPRGETTYHVATESRTHISWN
jgi:hypothetical protein